MKKVLIAAFLLSWAMLAGAQQNYRLLKADIPFDFQVNGKTLAAGQYVFGWNLARTIIIRPAHSVEPTQHLFMQELDAFYDGKEASIGFVQIGGQYFFKHIKDPGMARAVAFPSATERKYQKIAKITEVNAEELGK